MGKRVALVLGSGGARGYAHIGAIEVLEARGYQIACIAGSSMGAVVGGIYAAGKLPVYRRWVETLDYLDVLRLLDVSFSPAPSAASGCSADSPVHRRDRHRGPADPLPPWPPT